MKLVHHIPFCPRLWQVVIKNSFYLGHAEHPGKILLVDCFFEIVNPLITAGR